MKLNLTTYLHIAEQHERDKAKDEPRVKEIVAFNLILSCGA